MVERKYPLSHPQKRIWETEKFVQTSPISNLVGTIKFKGLLDFQKMEQAINLFILKNDSIRFRLIEDSDGVRQYISPFHEKKFKQIDLQKLNCTFKEWVALETSKPFTLLNSDLFDFILFKNGANESGIFAKIHHAIADAWSIHLMANKMMKYYTDLCKGKEISTQKDHSYIDFITRENNYIKSNRFIENETFWINELIDIPEPIHLKESRLAFRSTNANRKTFKLSSEITSNIYQFCKDQEISIFTFFISILSIYLKRITDRNQFVLGTTILNRFNVKERETFGMFTSTMPFYVELNDDLKVTDFFEQMKHKQMSLLRNQQYPFDLLTRKLREKNNLIERLFDISLSYQNSKLHISKNEEIRGQYETEWHFSGHEINSLSIHVNDREKKNELMLDFDYLTDLFTEREIETHFNRMVQTILHVLHNSNKRVFEIEVIPADEEQKLLTEFSGEKSDYSRTKAIHQLFEEQVKRTPNKTAIVFGNQKLTYQQLNNKANQLARFLQRNGVQPLTRVGVMIDRSIDMMVAIFAVLKAGGTYIPIDPSYPKGRITYMIQNSSISLLLSSSTINDVEFAGRKIDVADSRIDQENVENLPNLGKVDHSVYIMYTSGSTGRPKGICIDHQSLHNFIHGFTRAVEFAPDHTILSLTSMSFDPFVVESFLPLTLGMVVVIADEEQRQNAANIKDLIQQHHIDVIQLTPSRLQLLLNDENDQTFEKLQTVLVGGETLTNSLVQKLKQITNAKVYNIYGPTETTVWLTVKEINSDTEPITVGKPIANKKVYILNKNEQLQPIGITGELCISGEGIANGYLSNQELSLSKFVKNPFDSNLKMYKSGDLARWLPNGELELIGRNDDQVKIRGVRMELGEVQNQVASHPKIKEAVVLVKQHNGEQHLCAYYVAEEQIDLGELREYLSFNLPNAMIPTYFFPLKQMPLTPNGKVDRKKLPLPFSDHAVKSVYVAPRNETEIMLTNIWANLFNKKPQEIGINDHFLDLGGHSLKAIELLTSVQREFHVHLNVKDIFQYTTIKKLAEHIETLVRKKQVKITPVENKKYYPASTSQKRLFIINQTSNTTNYNMPGVFEINGAINKNEINKIFQQIIERHEAFRTSFKIIDGIPMQEIHRNVNFNVTSIDLLDRDPMELINSFIQPFDLSAAPLLRVYLIHVQKNKSLLFVDMHHMISDGTSIKILIEDFITIYEGKSLPSLEVQYKDFSHWQEQYLLSDEMKKQEAYWLEVFSDEVPYLNLPIDRARPSIPSYKGDQLTFVIDREDVLGLKKIARDQEATLFMVVFALYNIMLSKYSDQEDVTVGIPVIGRKNNEIKNVIGMFVNTLAIRSYPHSKKTFKEFLAHVKENLLKSYENQEYPFENLINKLDLSFDRSKSPLFNTMFTMQETGYDSLTVKDLTINPINVNHKDIKFDLSFEAKEKAEKLEMKIEYSTALFNEDTIQRMAKYFKEIVHQVIAETTIKLADIQLLTKEEQKRHIYEWNNTKQDIDTSKAYHELFEEQVVRTPNHIAVFDNHTSLTYKELNQRANQVARYLRSNGVSPDSIVGMMLERSVEMIIGILGILKAGAAYLPIDPNAPAERIKYMIQNSNLKILLTQRNFKQHNLFTGLTVDINDSNIKQLDDTNLNHITKPTNLAYVIYTSGSTGKPKGVMIEHRSLVNRIHWMQSKYPLTEADIIMQKTPFTFDVSVWELLWWSLYGSKVYLLQPNGEKEPVMICEAIEKYKITVMHFVPSMFTMFLDHLKKYQQSYDLSSLKQIFTSGEALLSPHVKAFHENIQQQFGTRLTNLYGPTEATIDVSYYDCDEVNRHLSSVPIGKPISNICLYVLNKQYQIQPVGVEGEIFIAGIGLARGYLNRKELTAEKFIENPFIPGTKMYRTGDIGRYLLDGNIEYMGRTDDQVKIRGNRVEIGEIEANLTSHEKITDAVVMAVDDENGSKELYAYYVATEPIPNLKLRNYLLKMLPDYMLPSAFVHIDRIPLNASGKVDRKALQKQKNVTKSTNYVGPRNDIEKRLTKLWADFLGIDEQRISMTDSFFELGGHSLKAISIISKVYEEFDVQLSLKDIFHSPTIKEQAEILIHDRNKEKYSKIEVAKEREYYPLTSSQKRLYLLEQVNQLETSYHLTEALLIKGELNKKKFQSSLQQLVNRHESLRTSFTYQNGEFAQVIHEHKNITIEEEDGSEHEVDLLIEQFITTFDLSEAPLFRVKLVNLKENKYLLLFDMHHIIADGVSLDILIRDFVAFYQDKTLPKLEIQYKDYAIWKNNLLNTEKMNRQAMYWKEVFYKEVAPLNLPYDFTRPNTLTFEGDTFSIVVNKQTSAALRSLRAQLDKTLYSILFAVYNVLLSKYTGQTDVVVGTPTAGRQHPDVENLIGMFVNTLAIRSFPEKEKTFVNYLAELNESILDAYENQDYPFEELLDEMKIEQAENQNPLFNTMFDLKMSNHEISLDGLQIEKYPLKRNTSKFDLSLETEELEENFIFTFEYNIYLFKQETIKQVAADFLKVLKTIIDNPYLRLADIQLEHQVEELKPINMEDIEFTFNS
ncbi:amino acid adenylation domain-containing protein [Bacillus aquiflavi]|uniref:non-ribosomal peptide synthetase n=1 Tax=Bacillus aquiflavi TaxID=2672567 RepID=UPI001CA9D77F|nr:non-ribosomal peptide synthetase [Bacillus aquiflavi]UAC49750.1 amino acid adenylation domain-containing protein [Bacillus aquiflavi]